MIRVSPAIQRQVIERLEIWAKRHPEPNAPVLSSRGRPMLPRDLVDEVAQSGELGQWFLHSLYTSYLVRLERGAQDESVPRARATAIMAEYAHADVEVYEVEDLETFLTPIERMIVENDARGQR